MHFSNTRFLAFCLAMSMGTMSFAEHTYSNGDKVTQEDRSEMMAKLATIAVINVGVNRGGQVTGMSTATKGVIHTASIFYTLGMLASNSVFYDLGTRSLIGGVAASFASTAVATSLYTNLPLGIGQALQEAGGLGTALASIACYETAAQVYQKFWDTEALKKWVGWEKIGA